MRILKVDYRNLLILVYFNTVKDTYSYQEIMDFLSLTYKQVQEKIYYLLSTGMLSMNELNIEISTDGIGEISSYNLGDINFYDLYSNDGMLNEHIGPSQPVHELYIPYNFDKKFKGY